MTHVNAKNEATRFNLGGFNDWRLPTPGEMSRIKNAFAQYHDAYYDFPTLRRGTYGCSGNYSYYESGTTARDWNAWKERVVFVRDVK